MHALPDRSSDTAARGEPLPDVASAGTEVMLCPDGPMLVRGPVTVRDDDGNVARSERPVSAVCRCGASRRKPWCDGAHKLLGPSA